MRLSVDLMNSIQMKNSMKLMHSQHSNNIFTPTGLARRAFLVLCVFLLSVGNAWGATSPTPNIEIETASLTDQSQRTFVIDWDEVRSSLGLANLSDLNGKLSIGWYVVDGSNNLVACNYNWSGSGYHRFFNDGDNYGSDFSGKTYVYWTHTSAWDDNFTDSGNRTNHGTISITPLQAWPGLTVKFVIAYDKSVSGSPAGWSSDLTYSWTFVGPDQFPGTFSGTPVERSHEVASRTSASTTIDVSEVLSTLSGAQYARFYLTKGGEVQDISSTNITVTGGQTTSKASRGVYLYTGSALTSSDLSNVTITLPAGTFDEYKLEVVFSDDEPAEHSGTTVTKEPAVLDQKYIYSFSYPITVIDKYIKWDTNSSDKFDITTMAADMGKSISDINSSYYIQWRINDGSSDISYATTAYAGTMWRLTSPTGGGTVAGGYLPQWNTSVSFTYLYSPTADLTTSLNTVGKMTVTAPNTDLFSAYPTYTVICDVYTPKPTLGGDNNVSDPTAKPALRYVFHFNETGKPVDNFLTDGKATSTTPNNEINLTTDNGYNSSEVSIQLPDAKKSTVATNWPSVDAKYIRIYVVDQNGEIVKDAISDTAPWLEMPTGFYRDGDHGYIWFSTSETKATSSISMPKLTMPSGKTVEDLENYVLKMRISTDAPEAANISGTTVTKEPAYDTEYTLSFALPFKGDATSATKVEKIFTLLPSVWTTDPREFSIDFDFANSKILLKDKDNSATLSSVSLDETFWDSYSSATLDGNDNFYIRWFLKSKSTGVETYIANSIRNINGASTYKNCAKEKYGRFWSTGMSSVKDLATIMRIKLDGTPDSPGTTFDVRDYDLVCTISTVGGETLNGSNQVTMEPATMQMQYTFHFADKPFEAENLSTVKTVYKTALYDKTNGQITLDLFSNYNEVLNDISSTLDNFRTNGYIRWYVVDASDNLVADMNDWGFTASQTYTNNTTYGHYILPNFYDYNKTEFNPIITLPGTYDKETAYKNYKVVCVVTTDRTGMSLPDCEPTTMQVKYVYNLILTDTEFAALPFVHYKGQSGRDWVVPDGSTGSMTQKIWNTSTGESEDYTGDIRQGVHTWEYNLYVIPGVASPLILPFEKYSEGGNNLEPYAYFRWYDWKTDTKVVNDNFTFTGEGTALSEKERGLFALNIGANPTQANIGVTFNPTTSFTSSIDIACDVSKYSDGLATVGGNTYLVHEPTLSNRYIFHVYPASVIANKLATSLSNFQTSWNTITDGSPDNATMKSRFSSVESTMFKTLEDAGKVVVSLNSTAGSFALRMQESHLSNYVIESGGNYYASNKAQWYVFCEDADGIWVKELGNTQNDRITTFTYSDFMGDYYPLTGGSTTHSISDGKKFHVVGVAGKDVFSARTANGIYAPVVHYELNFIDAPAIAVSNLPNNIERTDEYMKYHYKFAGVIDFDGNPETNSNVTGHEAEYYSTTNWYDAPTSSANNMSWTPFEWDDIQYGYCYPQLTPTIKNGSGGLYVSPEHGDYIIVKSMNAAGISNDDDAVTDPHRYDWWSTSELYDYTHTVTDNAKYGSFLYTDASNESRTIATLPFTSELCGGSSIYFTAAVANMTSNTIKPQLLIRIVGIDGDGKRHNVVSFHTCDISTTGATTGKWNQVYGESSIPVSFDDGITNFVAEVINYANDTNGADFAIDQIAIYTSTSKVQLKQTASDCSNPTDGKLKIYMDAEGLQNSYGKGTTEKIIYWRICREEDGSVVKGIGMYPQYDGGGNKLSDDGTFTYGMSKVIPGYTDADLKTEAARESDDYGWFTTADNSVFFQLANQNFPALDEGSNYYISVYSPHETFDASKESFWGGLHFGATSKCSIFSNFFVPRRQYVTYEDTGGTEGGELLVTCGGANTVTGVQMILKVPDVNEPTGFKTFKDLHYDYVFVPLSTWNSTTATFSHNSTDYKYEDLKTALAHYRGVSSSYKTTIGLDNGYSSVNSTYYNLLSYAIAEGLLSLDYSTTFTHTFTGTDFTVTCIPVEQTVEISGPTTTAVCSPFEVVFNLKSSSPEMDLGFTDVVYPTGYTKRVVRIGLEQLKNLRTGGYKLHIPVKYFKDKDKATTNSLSFSSAYLTTTSNTTDPTLTTVGTNFAKIVNPDDASADPVVDADHMYLALDLSGTNCAITFHEGYEYEVSTSYYDTRDASLSGRCEGDLFFIIKVVPEFVTWNPQVISGDIYNVNWNNDENWLRSSRTELYKSEDATQNTATTAQDGIYRNNADIDASLSTVPKTYVPMKFSYVTLPADCRAPSLINMDITAYSGSVYTGGILLAGDLGTDHSPDDDGTSPATTNIKYEMLVRYSYADSDNQNKCQGHYKLDGTTVVGAGDANIYDCEKFYGNICREIYFKPGAEMINQQRMTYKLAWVEKEMDRNKWYMLSSPLKGTYAGDMYLPATAITDYSLATPATVVGKQVTEAFQPITFNTTTYSRTGYPVYQRSWDHSEDGGKVYTETSDIRATDYTANLKFSGAISSSFAQWTHTYNDMSVKYSDLQGFSLRAHKRDGASGEKVLFRWPKADVSYNYYDYKDTEGSVSAATAKGDGVYGRFVTDDYDNKAAMSVSLDETNVNTDNGYYLVGNPYMSSIDMAKFFAKNAHLSGSYWKIDGNPATSTATGQIKPMESFFVNTTSPTTAITFDNSMMIDGNAPAVSSPSRMQIMTLTAKNERGRSEACIKMENGQDVETLFDSNLENVPMVYTVADGRAVSINCMEQLETVCFGVTCASDEAVNVKLQGMEYVGGELYMVDAVTGESTEVKEGSEFAIMPNEYGRYFLTRDGDTTGMKDQLAEGIRVSVHGGMVSVTAAQDLGTVRAVSVSGATMYQESGCGQIVQFQLQQGVYVIETNGAAGRQTTKIFVR